MRVFAFVRLRKIYRIFAKANRKVQKYKLSLPFLRGGQ